MAKIRDEPLRRTPHKTSGIILGSYDGGTKMGSPARVQPPSGGGSQASSSVHSPQVR